MNIDEAEKRHKAFMRYDGNDAISLLIHAGELQADMLAELKRLQKRNEWLEELESVIKQLRKDIEGYIAIWDYLDPKGYARQEEKFLALLNEYGFDEIWVER
jgi:hypothetical protein